MWTWIIILLVVAGGLAIWMGTRKPEEGGDESAAAGFGAPDVSETPASSEPFEETLSEETLSEEEPFKETPPEESGDEDKPVSM